MTEHGTPTDETSVDSLRGARTDAVRKPRIAIMGEFSAGKSTLSNLLIGAPALPVKVTATQLPPVWISAGNEAPYSVDLHGVQAPVDLLDIGSISVADTQFVRVFHDSDSLDVCDLIDMPGISDPNMPAEVWQRVMDHADAVIWCTHATQAWRQSEAAVWETFPSDLHQKSLLLLTRFDKISGERDRMRLIRRVESETQGLFRGVYPISLTQALAAGEEDFEAWKSSGADDFARALIEVTNSLAMTVGASPGMPAVQVAERRAPEPVEVAVDPAPAPEAAVRAVPRPAVAEVPSTGRIVPQRVTRRSAGGGRPARERGGL